MGKHVSIQNKCANERVRENEYMYITRNKKNTLSSSKSHAQLRPQTLNVLYRQQPIAESI